MSKKIPATTSNPSRKLLSIIGTVLGWFAVLGQLVLIITNRQAGVIETIIRFFSFFTILTNILVSLYFSSQIINRRSLKFIKNDSALTAITAFILIVGLVYQIVLRSIWEPKGFQMVIDELLHTVIPIYTLMYWFLYVKFQNLKLRYLFGWLLYPVIYFIFIIVRGQYSGYYPYPFIDVASIGLTKVLINFIILSVFAMILLAALYLVARLKNK
ncbi:hypothetical protein SAMN03097699_0942 [Flavobacteriaceae bacterium MAR_2010_188]|nr:hypothetical protein SAMN03097699_0942 [Flavobacteriaceae bacterium MAR_2010_188]